jgi:hypothetical protein
MITISAVISAAIAKVGNDNKVLLTANQMRNKSGVKSERENPSESNVISQYQVGEVSKLGVTYMTLGNCLCG